MAKQRRQLKYQKGVVVVGFMTAAGARRWPENYYKQTSLKRRNCSQSTSRKKKQDMLASITVNAFWYLSTEKEKVFFDVFCSPPPPPREMSAVDTATKKGKNVDSITTLDIHLSLSAKIPRDLCHLFCIAHKCQDYLIGGCALQRFARRCLCGGRQTIIRYISSDPKPLVAKRGATNRWRSAAAPICSGGLRRSPPPRR